MLQLWMVCAVCTRAYYQLALPIYLKGQKFSKTHFQPFELYLPTEASCHHMNLAILKSEIWLPEDSRSDSYCWLQKTWIFHPKWCIIIQLVFPLHSWSQILMCSLISPVPLITLRWRWHTYKWVLWHLLWPLTTSWFPINWDSAVAHLHGLIARWWRLALILLMC